MNKENARISVLIISPPGRWRSSLCVLLHANAEIIAVYQADGYAAGLQAFAENHPDIVLLDGGLPGEECWLALEHIRQCSQPQVCCVVLAHDSAQEQRAVNGGANGVLQVGFSGEALYKMVHTLTQ